jgi:hypothetical protein
MTVADRREGVMTDRQPRYIINVPGRCSHCGGLWWDLKGVQDVCDKSPTKEHDYQKAEEPAVVETSSRIG